MSTIKPILIVEDDSDIREALCELLALEGYGSLAARNGREALEQLIAANPSPSLILLDMMMPEMNGDEFLDRKLALEEPLRSIPVVILSANHASSIDPKLAQGFIRKPIESVDRFLQTVQSFAAVERPTA